MTSGGTPKEQKEQERLLAVLEEIALARQEEEQARIDTLRLRRRLAELAEQAEAEGGAVMPRVPIYPRPPAAPPPRLEGWGYRPVAPRADRSDAPTTTTPGTGSPVVPATSVPAISEPRANRAAGRV